MIRVALVHDWLTGMRGGEIVLAAIAELFPRAELFTLLYIPGKISPPLSSLKRHTSWLGKVPGAEKRYRYFLPVMPKLIENFDLTRFDLIISSSHCVAKGIRKPEGSIHISYVHAPMRYIWDRYEDYFGPTQSSLSTRIAAKLIRRKLQTWDRKVSQYPRVDKIIANSHFIANQVFSAYGRNAEVIYPFAELERFTNPRKPGRNYLMVTAFAPYKRIDLAIEAFNHLKLPLLIVGSGQDEKKLKKMAGPTIEFLGPLHNSIVSELYSKCRAFIFPGIEDFGITPIEAMASGAPVITIQKGGAAESVTEKTGLFIQSQTTEALIGAIQQMEINPEKFSEVECRKRAQEFSKEIFQNKLKQSIQNTWLEVGKKIEQLHEVFNLSKGRNI